MAERDRLSPEAYQRKIEYNRLRNKELNATFLASLSKEEYYEITNYLKSIGMTKADFVRFGYDKLRED